MIRKTVRFYELKSITGAGVSAETKSVADGFWRTLGDSVKDMTPGDRQVSIRGRQIYGEYRTGKQPALGYFYIGAVRDRGEWPDTLSGATGNVGDLEPSLKDAVLLEQTYVVPFGHSNQIAMLTMTFNSPRVAAVEGWVNRIARKLGSEVTLILRPVINPTVLQKLEAAQGAAILRVKVGPRAEIPEDGGGMVGKAARAAKEVSYETDVELGWSLGRRSGDDATKSELLHAARWVREDWVKSASVSLEIETPGKRLQRKQYDLIKEEFTSMQKFEIRRDEKPSELSVLTGIAKAIESFQGEFGSPS